MRWVVVIALLAGCATTKPETPRAMPEGYLDCKPRFRNYRCCPRDFVTHKVVGECYDLPRD